MTSGRSDGTTVHKARNQRPAFGSAPPVNGDAHPHIAPANRESALGTGNPTWNNDNVWGVRAASLRPSFGDRSIDSAPRREQRQITTRAESPIDGKTGSKCLLPTSESDWTGQAGLWGMSSGNRARISNGTSVSGISTDRPVTTTTSGGKGHSRSSLVYTSLLTDSTALPPANSPDAPGLRALDGYSNNHPKANGSAFPNNSVSSRLQSNNSFTPTEREFDFNSHALAGNNSDSALDMTEHALMSLGRNPNNLPRRPTHSAHQSFHSDLQENVNPYGSAVSQNELALALGDMQINGDAYSRRPRPQPQRPIYPTHASFDASLMQQGQFADDLSPHAGNYATNGMSNMTQQLASLRHDSGAPSSPADSNFPLLHNNNRSVSYNPARGHVQTQSGSYLAGYPQNRPSPDLSTQRLHSMQHDHREYRANLANTLQSGMHLNQGHNYVGYSPNGGGNASQAYYRQLPLNNMQPVNMGPMVHRNSVPTAALESEKLQEFKASNRTNKRWELKDIYGYIVEFSGDQHGSRFIQQKLETANSDEKERVFSEVQTNATQLMRDLFGNYVVQKLFEHGSMTQKRLLANYMKGQVHALSVDPYGCRVVQKALEHVLTEQQSSLVKELENHVEACVQNQNGNHVIQKAIERLPTCNVRFIIDAFRGRVLEHAKHSYGCRVIQRMLEHCEEVDRRSILAELHSGTERLIPDQYGNYVVQHVLENGEDEDRNKMISVIKSQLLSFSKHKFASNVVEKSIQFGGEAYRSEVLRTVLGPNEMGEYPLLGLMRDNFGNYVIQKLLTQLEGEERALLARQIEPHLAQLKKITCGKQISIIERLVLETHGASPSTASPTSQSIGTPAPGNFNYSPATTAASFPLAQQSAEGSQSESVPSTSPSMGGALVEQQRQSEPSSVATTPLSETMDVPTPSKCKDSQGLNVGTNKLALN